MNILFTGGSGTLGRALRVLAAESGHTVYAPSSSELDITSRDDFFNWTHPVDMLVHCAAWTDVMGADKNLAACMSTNVLGTVNVAQFCMSRQIKLVHISTDHVFDGERGDYRPEDPINPVSNYALSKGAAELTARMVPGSLVIRTSFYKTDFPYQKAFVDQWSTKDYIDRQAPRIWTSVISGKTGILHVAGPKRSIYDIARERRPDVQAWSRADLPFRTPRDSSLID